MLAVDWGGVASTLPHPAWRRHWLAQYIVEAGALLKFPPLLQKLDADAYSALRRPTPRTCYKAVLEYCAKRFPIVDVWFDDDDAELGSWTHDHIPVAVLGINWFNDTCPSPALALAASAYLGNKGVHEDMDLSALDPYREMLPRQVLAGEVEGELAWLNTPRPPRRREWKHPWQGLGDLYAYANADTGYGFLDTVDEMIDVYSLPEWDIDEIRGLVDVWARARGIYERALELARYVDERPRERLPVLANALIGDPGALIQITDLKPGYRKTLADVFMQPQAPTVRQRVRVRAR